MRFGDCLINPEPPPRTVGTHPTPLCYLIHLVPPVAVFQLTDPIPFPASPPTPPFPQELDVAGGVVGSPYADVAALRRAARSRPGMLSSTLPGGDWMKRKMRGKGSPPFARDSGRGLLIPLSAHRNLYELNTTGGQYFLNNVRWFPPLSMSKALPPAAGPNGGRHLRRRRRWVPEFNPPARSWTWSGDRSKTPRVMRV